MNNDNELEKLMNLDYDVILKIIGGKFYLIINELSIIVEGKSIGEAYNKLESKKKEYFSKIIEFGTTEMIQKPKKKLHKKMFFSNLFPFFIKTVIIAGVFYLGFFILIGSISYTIKNTVSDSVQIIRNEKDLMVDDALREFTRRYQMEIYRLRLLGLVTNNPMVHYKASLLKVKSGNIKGAIEEIELALGLLSMGNSDKQVIKEYQDKLAALQKLLKNKNENIK